MSATLDASFEACRRLARREGRNFYFSFLTLPPAKRDAMCAIYAWMRQLDDLADSAPSLARAQETIQQWRAQTRSVLKGDPSTFDSKAHPFWPAFAATVERYRIPHGHFDEIAEGALMDQEITRYATFDDLYRYCYRVASVVGLVSLRIFEYTDPRTEQHGEWLGIAFQLTNILRDVREDAGRGRIYIPTEFMSRYGVREEDVLNSRWSAELHDLLKFFTGQAEDYYLRARPVADLVSRDARPTLRIMTEIYHGILNGIRRADYCVLDRRVELPTWKKLAIVIKYRFWRGKT